MVILWMFTFKAIFRHLRILVKGEYGPPREVSHKFPLCKLLFQHPGGLSKFAEKNG